MPTASVTASGPRPPVISRMTSNEDGAHHCIAEIAGALNDIGYTVAGQGWTYWNKGPGPGDEEYLTSDETEWSNATGVTAGQNLLAVAPSRTTSSTRGCGRRG